MIFSIMNNDLFLGYLVHYLKFDCWSYISKVHRERVEERELVQPHVDEEPSKLFDVYLRLLKIIESNAEAIDSFYRKDGLMREFDLETLFSLIDNNIFNFVVLTTMSQEEKKIITQSENLPSYMSGALPILETYKKDCVRSHRQYIRRLCACLDLIFIRVRGHLMNPMSFILSGKTLCQKICVTLIINFLDLVNKYRGSVLLLQALSQTGMLYSYDTYRRIRYIVWA